MADQLRPAVRRAISQIGGLRSAQTNDNRAKGRAAVQAKRRRYFDQTDPALPEGERWRLADLQWREQLARARLARGRKAGR